jgi:hydrogenase nickel incorporation protein HypB
MMIKKKIQIKEDIFSSNDQQAEAIRLLLDQHKLFSINIMASPGAGKTSLIEHTIGLLRNELHILVIDGDIATSIDAERAKAAGAASIQINTGGGCHLDAFMVDKALSDVNLAQFDLLIVENVGNLVCPASFQLGTHKNILVASIPEGDDKPYKYPGMYQGVDGLVINKIDLMPYVPFRMDYFLAGIELLNPGIEKFMVSCSTREGIKEWSEWLVNQVRSKRSLPRTTG